MVFVSNITIIIFILLSVIILVVPVASFVSISLARNKPQQSPSSRIAAAAGGGGDVTGKDHYDHLYSPAKRDVRYGGEGGSDLNVAQYLVDLHDTKATLDFCGGMMFQLVISDQLRNYLVGITKKSPEQNVTSQLKVFDASKARMFQIPEYEKTAKADNLRIFHGREIRKVTDAAGGMGMVLQLSLANTNGDGQNDPEGWTQDEIDDYDGWGHDVGRPWRTGERLEKEGLRSYRKNFGPEAFGLHHRFYLHFDSSNKMWLSAEDGCEGTPAASVKRSSIFDFFNA